ncbi:hypothetical protein PTSG_08800 [Salpingoeca rosetta]|uniref:EamA domain-containing protein n=1 Tax=Salpingoeca rosetta (strain ATCC 50818 / BSB-021) TaxID=946362 RepID=F2UKQ8_SALR5|nr:uncharacterized protein PTSG_08800 [Salpingoeca rosetta]EGD77707.1 hypothetical protein PTSG_08800 [Salpingoeca rosetta]|eukprot:XP_004990183.1 hypothetical protein PTSG_08800 [Salpingoeca rosetta]
MAPRTQDAAALPASTHQNTPAPRPTTPASSALPSTSTSTTPLSAWVDPSIVPSNMILSDKPKFTGSPARFGSSSSSSSSSLAPAPSDSGLPASALPLTDVTITAEPATNGNSRYMWLALFLMTLFTGAGIFLFRVQVVVMGDDDALDPGTFIAFLCLGSFVGQLPYVLHLARQVTSARPTKFVFLGAFAGIFNCAGMNGYVMMTTDGGEASLLAPLTSLWVVLPVLYGVVVIGDRLSGRRWFGVLLSIGAGVMFAFSGGGEGVDFSDTRTVGLYFLCFFGWGICTILFQLVSAAKDGSFAAGYAANVFGFALTGVIFVAAVHRSIDWHLTAGHAIVAVGGCLHGLGTVGFLHLCKTMPEEAAVVAPLSTLTVLWPVFFGMIILGESSPPLKIAGIIAAVFGALLMGIQDLNELKDMIFKKRGEPVVYEHVNLLAGKPVVRGGYDVSDAVEEDTRVVIRSARARKGRVTLTLEVSAPLLSTTDTEVIHLPTITLDPNTIEQDDDDDGEGNDDDDAEGTATTTTTNNNNNNGDALAIHERERLTAATTTAEQFGFDHQQQQGGGAGRLESTSMLSSSTLPLLPPGHVAPGDTETTVVVVDHGGRGDGRH